MPYIFTCPHCQTKTQVEDRYSGQAGECVTCGGAIQMPQFSSGLNLQDEAVDTKPFGWAVAAGVLLVILGCLVFAVFRYGGQTVTQLAANRMRTSSIQNLTAIAKALNAYAKDFQTYPPPVIYGPNRKAMHSWRVLILPYLDEQELYDQYDMNKAWDDPVNANLAYQMPGVYSHPNASPSAFYPPAAYYLITGEGTLFPSAGPMGPDQVLDDLSQTILVIEGAPTSSSWTQPVDLDYSLMKGQINGMTGFEAGGLCDGGAAMVTVDERGHFLPDSTPPSTFNALVTPSGREPLADDTLD